MTSLLLQSIWTYGPLVIISFLVLRGLYRKYFHPLHHVPGPYLASTTNLWRLAVFLRGRQHHEYLALFQKYGPLVRLGPNTVILDDPAHFSEYSGFDKSPWWRGFRASLKELDHGQILNTKEHVKAKSRIAGAYSMSNVLKGEGKMDGHISELMNQFSARCGTIIDLAPWMQWAAFDIAMEAAFSNPVGFIKAGSDVRELIGTLHKVLTAAGTIALFPSVVAFMQKPWIFHYLAPNPTNTTGPGALYGLAWRQITLRSERTDEEKHNDILQWLIDHEDRAGGRLSNSQIQQECTAPVLAGSDTSATVLRTVVLHLSTNRRVLDKLRSEIDAADQAGLLSTPPQFNEIRQHIPYVAAVMKEALRLYPVLGSPVPREVPKEGTRMCGYYLPPGTEVGLCQYATGRNTRTYGEDADRFRPERWTEDVDPETKKLREKGDVFFGTGAMICTGRNLATAEVWKVATQIFRQFEVEVINPVQPWQEKDSLAMLNWDFMVRFEPREKHVNALK